MADNDIPYFGKLRYPGEMPFYTEAELRFYVNACIRKHPPLALEIVIGPPARFEIRDLPACIQLGED